MLNVSENILIGSLDEALETMAFMSAMPPEEELAVPSESVLVTMDFSGCINGKIEVMASKEFTWMLAANVMGIDCEDDEAHEQNIDAYKEFLNTTCGVLLPQFANSPEDFFDVSIPQAEVFSSSDDWDKFTSHPDTVVLEVDGTAMAARVTIDS